MRDLTFWNTPVRPEIERVAIRQQTRKTELTQYGYC
jgi:hypothetical protein